LSPSQAEHKADLLAKFKRGAITRRELVAAAAGMLGGLTIAHDLLPLTHHHPPLAHAAGGIASDNFDRAGPPLGGAWRVRQQDGSDTFFIGSGPNAGKLAQLSWPATTPSGAFALWIDNEFNLTQFSQATFFKLVDVNGSSSGPCVRCQSPSWPNNFFVGYAFRTKQTSPDPGTRLLSLERGNVNIGQQVWTTLAEAPGHFANGDVVRIEAQDNVITCFVNGGQKLTFTDTSPFALLSCGHPGICQAVNNSSEEWLWDDWSGGETAPI